MAEPDHLLTTNEVAQLLRVSNSTVRYWRHVQVGPPSFRARRHVLYWRSEVLEWIAKQQQAERRHVSWPTRRYIAPHLQPRRSRK